MATQISVVKAVGSPINTDFNPARWRLTTITNRKAMLLWSGASVQDSVQRLNIFKSKKHKGFMNMILTERDREIMKFINQFGFCEIVHIEKWFGLRKPRSYKVMQRLVKEGLVIHERILHGKHGIFRLSRNGARHTDLPPVDKVYLGNYYHQLMVIAVYMQLIKRYPEAVWISERELIRDKFKKYKMEAGQRGHIADGVLLFPDNRQIAIEVELTMKGSWRLERIFSNLITEFDFRGAWYYCAPQIMKKMIKAADDYDTYIKIFSLAELLDLNSIPYLSRCNRRV